MRKVGLELRRPARVLPTPPLRGRRPPGAPGLRPGACWAGRPGLGAPPPPPATHPGRLGRGLRREGRATAAGASGGGRRALAPLPSNWRRRRTARSARPGGEPRAGGSPRVCAGPARGRVCSRAPAQRSHVCAGPGACGAGAAPRVRYPGALGPGPSRRAPATSPTQGGVRPEGGGPGAALWEAGPRGVAQGAEIGARPPAGCPGLRDVAGAAEPGHAVLGNGVPGAGKPPPVPLSRVPILEPAPRRRPTPSPAPQLTLVREGPPGRRTSAPSGAARRVPARSPWASGCSSQGRRNQTNPDSNASLHSGFSHLCSPRLRVFICKGKSPTQLTWI